MEYTKSWSLNSTEVNRFMYHISLKSMAASTETCLPWTKSGYSTSLAREQISLLLCVCPKYRHFCCHFEWNLHEKKIQTVIIFIPIHIIFATNIPFVLFGTKRLLTQLVPSWTSVVVILTFGCEYHYCQSVFRHSAFTSSLTTTPVNKNRFKSQKTLNTSGLLLLVRHCCCYSSQ